jgi:phosphatidate cytidylyltransferase
VNLSHNLTIVFGGILGLLVLATAVDWVLRKRTGAQPNELTRRIRSWWVMAFIFALALVVDRRISLLFFAALSFVALKEYLSLIPTRRADRRILFWIYLSIPFQYLWIYQSWYGMFIIFIPVYMFLFVPIRMVLAGEPKGFLKAAGTLHWGLMTTVFSLSHAAGLLVLPEAVNSPAGAAGVLLFLVVLTQLNDVAQFIWGKALGKRKVVPTVSPNKTLEGLVGGVATTSLLAFLAGPLLTPFSRPEAAVVGLVLGLLGFFGDVSISALKRDLGIKDSGGAIPGHGGVLDRVDSLTYTAPIFFHYLRYFHS